VASAPTRSSTTSRHAPWWRRGSPRCRFAALHGQIGAVLLRESQGLGSGVDRHDPGFGGGLKDLDGQVAQTTDTDHYCCRAGCQLGQRPTYRMVRGEASVGEGRGVHRVEPVGQEKQMSARRDVSQRRPAGTSVTVSGRGFNPGETVNITYKTGLASPTARCDRTPGQITQKRRSASHDIKSGVVVVPGCSWCTSDLGVFRAPGRSQSGRGKSPGSWQPRGREGDRLFAKGRFSRCQPDGCCSGERSEQRRQVVKAHPGIDQDQPRWPSRSQGGRPNGA